MLVTNELTKALWAHFRSFPFYHVVLTSLGYSLGRLTHVEPTMEVVGAGANVLAFVGLSANLVRGIKDVHRFFKDFKDAPEDAKRVAEHIKLLNDILVETHIAYKDGSLDPDLTDAIRPCERIIDRLRARVVCFRTEDMGTRQKLWGKFKNAVNKKELNEDLQALDRACDALQRWCHKEDR